MQDSVADERSNYATRLRVYPSSSLSAFRRCPQVNSPSADTPRTHGVSASYAFAAQLHYRLWHSPTYRTSDPAKADLFFVPALTRPTRVGGTYGIRQACEAVKNASQPLEAHLPFLTPATATRHILAVSYSHEAWEPCTVNDARLAGSEEIL